MEYEFDGYRCGAFMEHGVLVNLPGEIEETEEKKAFSEEWDVLFRVEEEGIGVQLCGNADILFQVRNQEREGFLQAFMMLLEHPDRCIGMDLEDIREFVNGYHHGAFYTGKWNTAEAKSKIEKLVQQRTLLLFTGISLGEINEFAGSVDNQKVMIQSICDEQEAYVYAWCLKES